MGQIKVDDAVAERNQETSRKYRDLYLGENGQAAFEKHIEAMPPEQQETERRYLEQLKHIFGRTPAAGA